MGKDWSFSVYGPDLRADEKPGGADCSSETGGVGGQLEKEQPDGIAKVMPQRRRNSLSDSMKTLTVIDPQRLINGSFSGLAF